MTTYKHTPQQVTLTDTHLNITSLVGPMSMELLPPPGSTSPAGGPFFQRLKQHAAAFSPPSSSPSSSGSGGPNPVSAAKRANPKYPFCEMAPHGLSLMEFGALSFLAYLEKESPSFQTFFEAAFDPAEWTIMRAPEPRPHGAVFLDAYNRRMNLSVVATRGTNPRNLFDVFQVGFLGLVGLGWSDGGALLILGLGSTSAPDIYKWKTHRTWCSSTAPSAGTWSGRCVWMDAGVVRVRISMHAG